MKKVYIRWMSALEGFKFIQDEFGDWYKCGKEHSLRSSFAFELARKDEAACEPIKKVNGKLTSKLAKHGSVGLLIDDKAIVREFKSDCWSYYGGSSDWYTRQPKRQNHACLYVGEQTEGKWGEAWAKMDHAVIGIVVRPHLDELNSATRNAVLAASRRYKLPVYSFTKNGELNKMVTP